MYPESYISIIIPNSFEQVFPEGTEQMIKKKGNILHGFLKIFNYLLQLICTIR